MIQPISDHASKEVGAAQKGAVPRRRRSEHEMISASGAGVAAIQHELLCAEADLARVFVQRGGVAHQLAPIVRGVDIYFDDSRIGRDFDLLDARIGGRRIPVDNDGSLEMGGRVLDRGEKIDVVFRVREGRHEHM